MRKDQIYYNKLILENPNYKDFLDLLLLHIATVSDVRNKLGSGPDTIEIRTAVSSYLQEIVDSINRTKDNNTKIGSRPEQIDDISSDDVI